MPLSEKDKEFMDKVAAYFRNTKSDAGPEGSIRDTSIAFDINRNKVRKILVTMGEIQSPITQQVVKLRRQGMSIKDISLEMGLSTATISTYLPYEDKMDNSLDPSEHAIDVRKYRAYEKEQIKRQAGRGNAVKETAVKKGDSMADIKTEKEWQKDIKMSYTEAYNRPHRNTWDDVDRIKAEIEKDLDEDSPEELKNMINSLNAPRYSPEDELEFADLSALKKHTAKEQKRLGELTLKLGLFPGALNARNWNALEKIAGDRLPPEPVGILRLHMELYDEYPFDETADVLKKYGGVSFGNSISRDVIVPADIPLYALHYVIQRAFGWQNSHLRQFELPKEVFSGITDNRAGVWSLLTGILFRSPLMDEDDEFWADDYNGGSFKNWLRKKYTGPYISQCHGEGIISCMRDMDEVDLGEKYYVLHENSYNPASGKYDGEPYISDVVPLYDYYGKKNRAPKPWKKEIPSWIEKVSFEDLPADCLMRVFERNPAALLERLPISSVLAAGITALPENCADTERQFVDNMICRKGKELINNTESVIEKIIDEEIDSPLFQPLPVPVTDVLLYNYDFGDDWTVRITASENCIDLVESGRITQAELDRANVKCREVYRPVLIARDGEMLMDDVGGIHGFTDFLRTINLELDGMNSDERAEAKQEKKRNLEWARSLGWHREKVSDFNLL